MNRQEREWAGKFGNEYTARNRVDWRKRVGFFSSILDITGARSVFEFGCNAGWNLSAIKSYWPYEPKVYGDDINLEALLRAKVAGIEVGGTINPYVRYELAFTCGVLIHISEKQLPRIMQTVADKSSDYVMAIEYASRSGKTEPVEYRGKKDMLWRRDYGRLYQDMGLKLVKKGKAPSPAFDNCTYWLLRK